jgi:anti-sigma regulatory factor (Ser/Thr protein kinase)
MTANGVRRASTPAPDPAQDRERDRDRLTLDSRLAELARVAPWVLQLAARYSISAHVAFAMNLCLEESLSNAIRHGYNETSGRYVRVRFSRPGENVFELTVEDDAPHFNPLQLAALPTIAEDPTRVGGQGIRLMRSFADSIDYTATPAGNQLRLRFSNPPTP